MCVFFLVLRVFGCFLFCFLPLLTPRSDWQTPRSPDIFEISPRPFSVTPQPQNSGFQYSRGSSLRTSDFFSNGLSPPSIPSRSFAGGVVGSGTSGSSSGLGSPISSGSGISSSGSSHSYRQTQRKSPFSSGAIGTSLTDSDALQVSVVDFFLF